MQKINSYTHIEINPGILVGKPVIKGTRIPVYVVLNLLAHDYTPKRVVEAYPELTVKDVQACLAYASDFLQFQEEKEHSVGKY